MKITNVIQRMSIEEMETWLNHDFFKTNRAKIVLYTSIIIYAALLSIFTILRHYAFKTLAWDLGIFTQSLWTTVNGQGILYHTPELYLNPSGSFFGIHFSPILFLVLPIYWVAQTPETLLVLQSSILALAALPIYKLARDHAGGKLVGLVFAIAYLMFPATQFVNWYDFHVQAFLPLFFSYTIYYITKKNWPRYFAFMVLSLMCEEHVAQIIFFVGIYIAWKHRASVYSSIKRKQYTDETLLIVLSTMIVSIIWYWFTLWQRDTFFPTNPATLEEFLGSGNFSILGATNPLEVPVLIFLRPINAIEALAYDAHLKLLYLGFLFAPLALVSFKAPSALIPTIPWFVLSLVSQAGAHHTLGHQYEAYVVAFIFAAAIFAVKKNFMKKPSLRNIKGSLQKIMVCSTIFFLGASPLGIGVNFFFSNYTSIHVGDHEYMLRETLNVVPSNASILTQDNLFPHVSHRINAYVVPRRHVGSGIHSIVVDFVNQTLDQVEYVLVDNKTDSFSTEFILSFLENKTQFNLISSRDNNTILLYKRQLELNNCAVITSTDFD